MEVSASAYAEDGGSKKKSPAKGCRKRKRVLLAEF